VTSSVVSAPLWALLALLSEIGHAMTIAPFAARVIAVLPGKYDQGGGKVFGKKML